MLERAFQSAEIKQVNNSCYKLTIKYSYYGLYDYSDVFVYKTLQETKDRLIIERCHGHINIIGENNTAIDIVCGDG